MKRENILNNKEKPVLIGASQLMEEVFESGLYREMKTADNKLESIKKTIRKQFEDGESKRYELPNELVAKFVPFPKYETDEKGLKEFLDDFGLLTKATSLKANSFKEEPDLLETLKPFQKPVEHFAQFYLNSNGKAHIDKEEYLFDEDLNLLAMNFLEQKSCFESSNQRYKRIMKEIEACPFLQQAKSLKTNYGTCKLRDKGIEFHTHSVYDEFGSDFLIEYGQVSMNSLEQFISKGYFSSKDIQQFRKMIDINLRFVVMEKESEMKQSEFFHQQMIRKSQMRRFA
jgi:hypothetical protein